MWTAKTGHNWSSCKMLNGDGEERDFVWLTRAAAGVECLVEVEYQISLRFPQFQNTARKVMIFKPTRSI